MRTRLLALVTALAVIGGSATAALARARHAGAIRSFSRDSLRAGPDSARVAKLLSALDAGDPLVCEMIADQIGNFWFGGDDDGIGRFADAANANEIRLAKDSLHGHVSSPGAVAVLTKTLGTTNPCVRRVAAKLLGRSRIPSDHLEKLLDDPSPRVRETVAYAAGTGRVRATRPRLEAMLSGDPGPGAAMAAWALGEIKDDSSLAVLERALAHHADARVRASAARAVGEIGRASSIGVLSSAIDDPSPGVQYAAVRAFDNLHDVQAAPTALIKAARSSDAHLRNLAGLALAEIHDPASVETLLTFVDSDDRDVRLKVAEALGEIRSPKATGGLMRMMKDSDADVRRAATEALGEIRER